MAREFMQVDPPDAVQPVTIGAPTRRIAGKDDDIELQTCAPRRIGASNGVQAEAEVVKETQTFSLSDEEGFANREKWTGYSGESPLKATKSIHALARVYVFRLLRFGLKFFGVGMMVAVLLIAITGWPPTFIASEQIRDNVLSLLFLTGLILVALEDVVGLNKSAVMLLLAASMWTYLAVSYHPNTDMAGEQKLHVELDRGLKEVGSVILFLLPAMGIVEAIDHFGGFVSVTWAIRVLMAGKRERLLPIICLLTFFLSSVIDNLTATIVALKILRHIAGEDAAFRCHCGGLVVVTANAGGAWSPIGDVTTTMLWISEKISIDKTIYWLFFPSFVAGFLPLLGVYRQMRHLRQEGTIAVATEEEQAARVLRSASPYQAEVDHVPSNGPAASYGSVVALVSGMFCILLVPVLKMLTGLPPYLGMLLSLGMFWLATDALGLKPTAVTDDENGSSASSGHSPPTIGVVDALGKVDLTGLLFFTGVLLSVGSLDSAKVLAKYAEVLVRLCGDNPAVLASLLGISSAFVDNVPLVEGTIDMFTDTPRDAELWQLTALAAGTGGSILSVGSIAGVTLMSMEGVSFLWYFRYISPWAFLGFVMGVLTYRVELAIFD